MGDYQLELIETGAIIVLYFVVRYLVLKTTERVAKSYDYHRPRVKITKKVINLFIFIIAAGLLMFVWGVEQSELVFFITSLLTILGIAFFAQWSIISNITSTLIIFFNHPAKIGDTISVYDKEYPINGQIVDIGIFFVIIKLENGDRITIPSNLFMQKMITKVDGENSVASAKEGS